MINKARLAALLLVAVAFQALAQSNSKLDLVTWTRLHNGEVRNQTMHLLVKGDVSRIKQLCEQYHGHFKYSIKDIASVEIPESNLLAFSSEYAVQQIENPNTYGLTVMDTARMRNNIDSALAGFTPLAHDLKGRGVIVGIIDGGIDWQHEDFTRADGHTRIRYIWDEGTLNGANRPLPYNYGNQCTWLDIENGSCSHSEPATDSSHGTCVAGIAAGNGRSLENDSLLAGKYTGVAPESELIVVRIDLSAPNFATHMADAVDYIFKKADALGRPCVINTSLGSYSGAHDGKDLTSQAIDYLLDERNGRVLVAAAGNAGNISYHVGYNLAPGPDTAYTLFRSINGGFSALFDWWADTTAFKNAQFAIGCNDDSGRHLGRTPYFNVINDFNPSEASPVTIFRSVFDQNLTVLLGDVTIKVTLSEGRYHFEASIGATSGTYLWRLQTRGTGRLDLWASNSLIGNSDVVESLQGFAITDPHYRHSDRKKSMLSSWQNSDKVITVGNYSSRSGYLDVDSFYIELVNTFPHPQTIGERYYTSSIGPTRDGRTKPDLMATGSTIVCTGQQSYINDRLGHGPRNVVARGGKHIAINGTSMSAAIVTGIAALYLEKRPTANYDEVKTVLICTAVQDSFTTDTVNNEYGYGKVNGFRALTQTTCITFGAVDTFCINYNPQANVDSGSCVAKVYGCMDSTADNYDPSANINNGTCTYTGIGNLTGANIRVQVMPNPFTTATDFKIEGLNFNTGEIKIYNHLGAVVDVIKLSDGKTTYTYQNKMLAKGMYFYLLNADGRNVKAGKLVVE